MQNAGYGMRNAFVGLLLTVGVVQACSVPVFRYGLERWRQDVHLVSIASNVAPAGAVMTDPGHANLWLERAVNAQDVPVRVFFPDSEVAWYEGQWDDGLPTRLADSPLRRRIAHELLSGTTAVFVLLESSINATNAAVAAMLRERLAALTEEIELEDDPDYEDEADGWTGPDMGRDLASIPLRVAFTMHRLSRDNVAEQFLVDQLVALAAREAQPTAVSLAVIFGRGRTITLTGEELTPDIITEVCWFLCSACSCRVKALNPGIDLLLAANWDDALLDYPEQTVVVLPDGGEFRVGGTGVLASARMERVTPTPAKAAPDTAPSVPAPGDSRRQAAMLAAASLAVVVLLVALLKGRRK